ncbi:MAG: FAD-dependent oxidoreductase [Cyanobacteria bacterium P01_A01_bin.135]
MKYSAQRHQVSAFVGIAAAFYSGFIGVSVWRWFAPGSSTLSQASPGLGQVLPLADTVRHTIEGEWTCEVVVVGGSLGGVAAASQAMRSGAQTCLIEVSPWLGGQISAQGVSAIDESRLVRRTQNVSESWRQLKQLILEQPVNLPSWVGPTQPVSELNSCWVGPLCFLPEAGARAAETLLAMSQQHSPNSRWATATAFKGAELDNSGRNITAIQAVRRIPWDADYMPQGRLWKELPIWYSWSSDETFQKVPLRLVPPKDKDWIVIDATDTGELIAWADVPYRLGSESWQTTGEWDASERDNPDCTQAFTFTFAMAIADDGGASQHHLGQFKPDLNIEEHWRSYSLESFPMFSGRSFFNYRRIVSLAQNSSTAGTPVHGDITLVNWHPGNDWNLMDPPLILNRDRLEETQQFDNWMGGLSISALRHGGMHALLFSRWLIETQAQPDKPLSLMFGGLPMGTETGLSMVPYIREGRRILGRAAYGDEAFMLKQADMRVDHAGGRDLKPTSVAVAHYDMDIHGCRYRNWTPSYEASSAPTHERNVRPTHIPLESLIPQQIDNLMVGSKAIAVTHITNSVTRIHQSEWNIGAAAGATAGWLVTQAPELAPAEIVPYGQMAALQAYLRQQGLQPHW